MLDVNTGGVVAMYSNPTFDPTPARVAQRRRRRRSRAQFLLAAPDNPLLARAWREIYPPGSTFKTVTAATALDDGVDVNKKFPLLKELPLPLTTNTLKNFGDERCGGSLEDGLHRSRATRRSARSASTSATGSRPASQRFGVEHRRRRPPTSIPSVVRSIGPKPGTFKADAAAASRRPRSVRARSR